MASGTPGFTVNITSVKKVSSNNIYFLVKASLYHYIEKEKKTLKHRLSFYSVMIECTEICASILILLQRVGMNEMDHIHQYILLYCIYLTQHVLKVMRPISTFCEVIRYNNFNFLFI